MTRLSRPVLFDSSVYVAALRGGVAAIPSARGLAPTDVLWLSAVVLEELYAGASDRARRIVERLERDFSRANRVLVPNLSDWTWTGRILAKLGARYGYGQIGRGRLTNDALALLNFRREPIYLPEADIHGNPDYRGYTVALRRIPELHAVRDRFVGRSIHRSLDAWKKQVAAIIAN